MSDGVESPVRANPLQGFGAATRTWFSEAFAAPTDVQSQAWAAIGRGDDTLLVAPTGSGKTLAAFLTAIDGLLGGATAASVTEGENGIEPPSESVERPEKVRVLYLSPLKALAADVDRNLRRPLRGITAVAGRSGQPLREVSVGMRTGDTTPAERRRLAAHPPDILITTPESLFLLLTSQARSMLTDVEMVIIDEIHSLADSKRGAHLAVSLERLDAMLSSPAQRVGLSATVRPLEEVARFLSGGRPVTVVNPQAVKRWQLDVVVPVEDMSALGQTTDDLSGTAAGAEKRASIWPHVEARLVNLITEHTSTLVFANSRRVAERLTSRVNEIWDERRGATDEDENPAGDMPTDEHGNTGGRSGPGTPPGLTHRSPRPPAQIIGGSGQTAGRVDPSAPVLARAHHGSVSREQRSTIEESLKAGTLPAVVATSSLELGIDMGDIDLVVQIDSPPSVASGLQRVGRAGHQVGATSHGVFFPTHRGDLVRTAVVTERMRNGLIETMHVPANPLDVLAQQIVAMCAMDVWTVDEVAALMRRTAPFSQLTGPVLDAVLDMLSGRYPSEEFAALRPRIVWDRLTGELTGRPGAQRLAVTSGGTIPDRGLFGVFVAGDGPGRRVGELDEEMVYESRVGDVFTLGTSSWRIEEITHDQVIVTPAPGVPGRLPFWKGDTEGRAAELGTAIGAFVREVSELDRQPAAERIAAAGLDAWATDNLIAYLREQREATGAVPTDRTVVVERFHDELGDWQIVVHSPFGSRVHAPWALALAARIRERFGVNVQAMHADDGIVIRLPEMAPSETDVPTDPAAPSDWSDIGGPAHATESTTKPLAAPTDPGHLLAEITDLITIPPDEVVELVTSELGGSALFASRFRECAARALLLPRRNPGARQALWQQRRRSAQLLEVASRYPEFPVTLETMRECVQDVFDLDAFTALMSDVAARRVRVHTVDTPQPSPMARALLFGYVAQFLYEGDTPLAERRAAALSLDPALLADLLGSRSAAMRDLLDPQVVQQIEAELQSLVPERMASDLEQVTDLVRRIGPCSTDEVAARTRPDERANVTGWLAELAERRRLIDVRVAGESRWAAVEDAGRLLDGLGVAVPAWVPPVFLESSGDPLGELVRRYARTHGPFTAADVAARYGIGPSVAREALRRLTATGVVSEGEFRPGGTGTDYCDTEILRRIRRRSLARLREQVEPVGTTDLAVFLAAWSGVSNEAGVPEPADRGVDGVLRAVEQLAGVQLPASALESFILPARVADYSPGMLDDLLARGEVCWQGHGALAGSDGWISLHLSVDAPLTLAAPGEVPAPDSLAGRLLRLLRGGGGYFATSLVDLLNQQPPAAEPARAEHEQSDSPSGESNEPVTLRSVSAALWELVWAGHVGNDTFAPVRALLAGGRTTHKHRTSPPRAVRPGRRGLRSSLRARRPVPADTPGVAAGRWTRLPATESDPTVRSVARADVLLDRYGILTRGAVQSEDTPGGFAAVYRVLREAEDSGSVRRGYLVEHLGASQFGSAAAIDRLRAIADRRQAAADSPAATAGGAFAHSPFATENSRLSPTDWPAIPSSPEHPALLLAATDPANPYGAALPWPDRGEGGHRPGRKAGSLVALVNGELAAYIERGGRTVLTYDDGRHSPEVAAALHAAVAAARVRSFTITTIDGQQALGTDHPLHSALLAAGFHMAPAGLRLRDARR